MLYIVLELLRKQCIKYHYEIEEVQKIVNTQPLGLLFIKLTNFKETVLPEPTRLLEIVEQALPE